VVFLDCVRFLSKRSLTNKELFSGEVDKSVVFELKQQYEQGRRPLRSRKNRSIIADAQVANLLLLWLGSLPHPLFPVEHAWHLVSGAGSRNLCETLKVLIANTEPFILEVLFPLFELLHHFHLNVACREETLSYLSAIFTPSIFGTKEEHGLRGEEYEALLYDACALLIKEYRGLFTSKPELQESLPVAGQQADPTRGDACAEHSDNKENVFEDALGGMITLTFERILESLDGDLEASPLKKCKTAPDESAYEFMNQFMNHGSSDTRSPTSVL
jgi:hypothetical protein